MNTPIPVGLIGLGRHGSRYLRHLTEEKTGGQLVAISRQHEDEGRRQAALHRVQFFPDYRDLIADPTEEPFDQLQEWNISMEECPRESAL